MHTSPREQNNSWLFQTKLETQKTVNIVPKKRIERKQNSDDLEKGQLNRFHLLNDPEKENESKRKKLVGLKKGS